MKWLTNTIKDRITFKDVITLENITNIDDIISIEDINVEGELIPSGNCINVKVHIRTVINMSCAITLQSVPVNLDFKSEIIYGNTNDSDYPLERELDLGDAIYGLIISEKPYRVISKNADKDQFADNKSSKPLSGLKDFLDK